MQKRLALAVALVLFIATFTLPTSRVTAQSKTITIPDNYPTLSAAVASANAGDTIIIREGNYDEPVNQTINIEKTLSIIGESSEKTAITFHPAYNVSWILTAEFFSYSDAIAIHANNCKIQNLKLIIAAPGGFISATGDRTEIIGNNIKTGPSTGLHISGSCCVVANNTMDGEIQVNGISNLIAQNLNHAIELDGSNNLVKENFCESIELGFHSNSTSSNVILRNTLVSTTRGWAGIYLSNSNNNYCFKNRLSAFSSGFMLRKASGNTIMANTVSNSLNAAINLGASSNNLVCLNNFVDNPDWVISYVYDQYSDPNSPNIGASINSWDNGNQGNYWENYNVTDINSDGIGDTPYTIQFKINNGLSEFVCGYDNFPLIARFNIDTVSLTLPDWALQLDSEMASNPRITFPSKTSGTMSPTPSPTITLSASSAEPTNPTPSVPELSWLIILPLLLSVFVAMVLRHRKQF
jgi:nitrous oxidase accessory protein